MKKTTAFAVVLIIAVALLTWFIIDRLQPPQSPQTSATFYSTLAQNPDYAQALAQVQTGDYQAAAQSYQAALASATDNAQAGQLALNAALAQGLSGDVVGSIDALKQIAANAAYAASVRAYALQQIGVDYQKSTDPAVGQEIFSDPPYTSMLVPSDPTLSARHIFDYAVSIYPWAFSELQIAGWYANQLVVSASTPQASSYLASAQQAIQQAKANIAIMQSDPTLQSAVPDILTLEATVLGQLALAGETTTQSVEDAYQKAIASYAALGSGTDGVTRLYYGVFLSYAFGQSRASDIASALAPLSTSAYQNAPVITLLRNAQNISDFKPLVATAGHFDPAFENLLISLGWTKSDFQ